MAALKHTPAFLTSETDVDTTVAVLLDRADADEAEAARNGRPRSAAAGVRKLRWIASTLGPLGTGEAFEVPESAPVERPRNVAPFGESQAS
jgi:hypothetical protein